MCVKRSVPHSLQLVLCDWMVLYLVLTNRFLCLQVRLPSYWVRYLGMKTSGI